MENNKPTYTDGIKEPETFDFPRFVGRKFKYRGKYGLSDWTDTVKSIAFTTGVEFNKPGDAIFVLNKSKDANGKLNILGYTYELYVVASKTKHWYEFDNCIFID